MPLARSLPVVAPRLWPWLCLAAALVVLRTVVFVTHPSISFDADQAVIGLMAKHIAEGRAWPVYQYALTYVVEMTAYVAAPFIALFGASPAVLRVPLLLMNVAVGSLLVATTARTGLRPALALVAALPLLLAPPATSAALMDVLGMTVEPLGFVLALWWLRERPVVLGMVAALGFRVREFVAYGVAALLLVELFSGRLLTRAAARHWLLVAVGGAGTLATIGGLSRFETPLGPGTWAASRGGGLETLQGAFCFAPRWAWRNSVAMATHYLGQLYGAAPVPVEAAIVRSDVVQGASGLWPLLGAALLGMLGRVAVGGRAVWAARRQAGVGLGLFLLAVGTQAVLVYAVSRCGPISLVTIRYALLGLFLPSGIALLFLQVEQRPAVRALALTALVAVAGVSAHDHVDLLVEQVRTPHVANRQVLAEVLERRGVRYAYSDYWTAYYVSFVTAERVLVVPDVLSRIAWYERELDAHRDEAVRLATTPCGEAPAVAPGYYVCDVTR